MDDRKIHWIGSSYEDLKDFPADAMRDAGFQLRKIQQDEEPDDWKPMATIGPGVREIRISVGGGAFRLMYVVKIMDLVHVLHCFHKTTQQTSQRDIEKGRARYREVEAAIEVARKIKKTTKGRRKKE
jgi:phage-related protein